ncbi:MAG: L-rhamnose mutarotase [Verrucomicrobia bacterium]|nr:L-rhamnose mutarotase [Verrucomicrobiota bacterium]
MKRTTTLLKSAWLLLLLPWLLSSCATAPPQRYAMVTGLKPEKEAYYRELHARPWPGVIATIRDCHIRNFSIHRVEIDGKPYLFAYFEYVGNDLEADMAKMAADPETQRWWKETDPCQIPLPEARAKGKIWTMAEEVFYTP